VEGASYLSGSVTVPKKEGAMTVLYTENRQEKNRLFFLVVLARVGSIEQWEKREGYAAEIAAEEIIKAGPGAGGKL